MKSEAQSVVSIVTRVAARVVLCLALAGAAGRPARGATPTMAVSEIHSGQKGYGLSDFGEGQGVRRFDVEILGVLKDYAPKQDLILARLSGDRLEETGIIAGMSGSPVYVDDKLIGAVAYGWPFSREPIAGITPIASMLDIRHVPPSPPLPIAGGSASGTRMAAAQMISCFAAGDFLSAFQRLLGSGGAPGAGSAPGWEPLPLPVSVPSGAAGESFLSRFLPRDRFLAVPAAAGAAGASAGAGILAPGSSISTILVSGDMTVAASGTVTWVDGENVLAFGHPFLSMGPVEMPMAGSEVISVLPSLYRSFKFASTGKVLGSITQDRSTGILGSFGKETAMVPVSVSIVSGDLPAQRYRFQVVRNSMLTPILAAMAIDSTLTTLEKSAGERTLVWKSAIATPGRTVHFDSVFTGLAAREQAITSLALLTNYLMANEFRDLSIDGIDVSIVHSDELKSARITDVEAEKELVKPGETVAVRIGLQDFRGGSRNMTIDIPIPPETPPGPLTVFVGDGVAATGFDLSLFPADPRSLDEVLDFLERVRPANTVNLLAYRPAGGAVVGGQELAGLPPSVLTLLASRGAADGAPGLAFDRVFSRTVEQAIPVTGAVRLNLKVIPRID